MRYAIIAAAAVLGLTAATPSANAVGCLSGAAAGAMAGHMAGLFNALFFGGMGRVSLKCHTPTQTAL